VGGGGRLVAQGGVAMAPGSAHLAEFAFSSSLAASSWPFCSFCSFFRYLFYFTLFYFLPASDICLCLVLLFPVVFFLPRLLFCTLLFMAMAGGYYQQHNCKCYCYYCYYYLSERRRRQKFIFINKLDRQKIKIK